MKKNILYLLLSLLTATGCDMPDKSPGDNLLWYDKPAAEWTEALPVGNGRLGGMLYGDPSVEHLQVNEESLWGGVKVPNNNPGALENFPYWFFRGSIMLLTVKLIWPARPFSGNYNPPTNNRIFP